MPVYPTVVSRRARSSFQSAGQSAARHTGLSASRTFIAANGAEAQAMADAMAKALANPANMSRVAPLSLQGLRIVFPWLNAIALGLLLKELSQQFFSGGVAQQNLTAADPIPGNYSVTVIGPPPWRGFPNNSETAPVAYADTGGGFKFTGLLPFHPMYANPNSYAHFRDRLFNAVPTGESWADDNYQRDYDLYDTIIVPGPLQAFPNLQHVFPEMVPNNPFPTVAPPSRIAREMETSPWEQGYKIGPETRVDLHPAFAPHPSGSPRSRQRNRPRPRPRPRSTPGLQPVAPGSQPIPYTQAPNVVIEWSPGRPMAIGQGPYLNTPPPRGTEEKPPKNYMTPNPRGVFAKIYGLATETEDAIAAVYKTLPKEVRRKERRTVQNMARLVWKHRDKLNAADIVNAMLNETAGDAYYGLLGKQDGKAQQALHDSGLGPSDGTTLSTRTQHLPGVGSPPM